MYFQELSRQTTRTDYFFFFFDLAPPLVPLLAFFLGAVEAALRSFLRWRHTRYLH